MQAHHLPCMHFLLGPKKLQVENNNRDQIYFYKI